MRRDRVIQVIAGLCMAVFFTGAGVLAARVATSSGRHRLVYADSAERGDPPEVALGIAMGAFRGLFVNWLWIRANELKQDGKYHEAVDLAKTITRLQPRFPKVWAFHAWNLAYNISVATQTPAERWAWVSSGIQLLRDQGIPKNPNDLGVHKELAWIFMHKIQGVMDDAHVHYKRVHAREWTIVLGTPPRITQSDRRSGDVRGKYVNEWLRPIADAPDTLDELYARFPTARALVERLSRIGLRPDKVFLERIEIIQSLQRTGADLGSDLLNADDPLVQVGVDPAFLGARAALLNYTRKRVLVGEYHMEPDRMIRYTERFGPLDWRHASAHAVYWSARGVEEALLRFNEKNKQDFDFLNTDRVTIQAIQDLFRTGTLYFDILRPDNYFALPNPDFIDSYSTLVEEIADRARDLSKFESESRTYRFYAAGYENFLRDAIRFLFRRGDVARAERYYTKLKTWPGLNANNIYLRDAITLPLEEFVVREITDGDRISSPPVALQEISGALESAFFDGLLNADAEIFEKQVAYARMFHNRYQSSQGFRVWVSTPDGRMGFPPFDLYASRILYTAILAAGIPQGPIMYQRAPVELQGRVYAMMEGTEFPASLNQAAEQQGSPPFDVWFPPPPGLDRYRAEVQRQRELENRGGIELK